MSADELPDDAVAWCFVHRLEIGSGPWMAYGCARNNFGDLCGLPSWTRQGPDSQWWVHRDDTLDVEWVAYHTDTEPEGCTAWEACR